MMTTVEVLVMPAWEDGTAVDPSDPYRYGWRYVRHDLEDGAYVMNQIPLTLEDVLHPQEGDHVTHNDAHQRRRRYVCNVLEARLAHDPSAVVLDDVRVAWDTPELRPHGPDIAVIIGVRERKNWSTFNVATEGVRPALIIEITSPETASINRSIKLQEYDLAGIPLYIIIDGVTSRKQPALRLVGYTQTPSGYQVLAPNAQGWLWMAPARTWLGIEDNEIVCYDEGGEPLGDYQALAATLVAETKHGQQRNVARRSRRRCGQWQNAVRTRRKRGYKLSRQNSASCVGAKTGSAGRTTHPKFGRRLISVIAVARRAPPRVGRLGPGVENR